MNYLRKSLPLARTLLLGHIRVPARKILKRCIGDRVGGKGNTAPVIHSRPYDNLGKGSIVSKGAMFALYSEVDSFIENVLYSPDITNEDKGKIFKEIVQTLRAKLGKMRGAIYYPIYQMSV